jgi:hypothetical protein
MSFGAERRGACRRKDLLKRQQEQCSYRSYLVGLQIVIVLDESAVQPDTEVISSKMVGIASPVPLTGPRNTMSVTGAIILGSSCGCGARSKIALLFLFEPL